MIPAGWNPPETMPKDGSRFRVRLSAYGNPNNGWVEGDAMWFADEAGRYSVNSFAPGLYTPDGETRYNEDAVVCWQAIRFAP